MPIRESHQVSRLWLVSFWSSEQFTGWEVEDTPPGINRVKTGMKPNFKSSILFSPNLIACKMGKIKVLMNKPVHLGQTILNLSKLVMYEFHYDYMIPKYDS